MGCHTWFYKKVNPQPTDEDKIQQFLKKSEFFRQKIIKAIDNGGFEYNKGQKEWYPFKSQEDAEKTLRTLDWMIKNVYDYKKYALEEIPIEEPTPGQNLYYAVNSWRAPIDEDSHTSNDETEEFDDLTMDIDGIYYSSVRRYHDIFRYYDYDNFVRSKEEMWKLIKDNNIKINEHQKKRLDEFWSLYPDGMIYFG